MTWALVLGGAKCVFEDAAVATSMFGEPDVVIAVKDIWMTWPHVDYVVSYHIDRLPRELIVRRANGLADPICGYTYTGIRIPDGLPFEIKRLDTLGGSSGLMGAQAGIRHADRAILAGIPLDPTMPHYHDRKQGKAWTEAKNFRGHWQRTAPAFEGRVRSMSGWTLGLLGMPTKEWLLNGQDDMKRYQVSHNPAWAGSVTVERNGPFLTNKQAKRLAQRLRNSGRC